MLQVQVWNESHQKLQKLQHLFDVFDVFACPQVWNESRQKLQKLQSFVVQQREAHDTALEAAATQQQVALDETRAAHRQEVLLIPAF